VYVSGDIYIAEGKTLNLAPGTVVHIAQDDILSSGLNPESVEIVVDGTLNCMGTGEQPIIFDCHPRDDGKAWGPIILKGGSAPQKHEISHAIFRRAGVAITRALPAAENRISLKLSYCSFQDVMTGVALAEMADNDTLSIFGCAFYGPEDSLGVAGVVATNAAGIAGNVITISASHAERFESGVVVAGGNNVSVLNTSVSECGIGMEVYGIETGGAVIGPGNFIGPTVGEGGNGIGLYMENCASTIYDLYVHLSDQIGVKVVNSQIEMYETTIVDSGLHGLVVESLDSGSEIYGADISNSGNSGLRIVDCSPAVSDCSIVGGSYAGVFCDNSSAQFEGISVVGPGSTGFRSTNGSDPKWRSSSVANVSNGVIVDPISEGDFGSVTDYGRNSFNNISQQYAINFNPNHSLLFYYNCYDNSPTPLATKFGSKYGVGGPILYLPGYCE
jgi:hypothetical protein